MIETAIVFCDSPAAKFSVPAAAVKSEPAVAVPELVDHWTLDGFDAAGLKVTVKTASVVPEFPSVTRTSAIVAWDGTSSSMIVPVPALGAARIARPPGAGR